MRSGGGGSDLKEQDRIMRRSKSRLKRRISGSIGYLLENESRDEFEPELAGETADVAAQVGYGLVAAGCGDAEYAFAHVEARARLLAVDTAQILDGQATRDGFGGQIAGAGAEGYRSPVRHSVAALERAVVPAQGSATRRVALEVGYRF